MKNNYDDIRKNYARLQKTKQDDGEKHRELSCRAGQKGFVGAVGIFGAGLLKEAKDFTQKSFNQETRQRYGGVKGVAYDSCKDIKNNAIGAWHGFFNRDDDCSIWSKK